MSNSPTPPNNSPAPPSNSPTPPSNSPTPPNNLCDIVKNFFQTFLDLITHDRLANFVQVLPYLIGLVLFLGPLALLIQKWSDDNLNTQNMSEDFKSKICNNSENVKLVQDMLKLEKNGNETIGKITPIDNKNNSQINQLPFSCEYTLLEGNNNSGSRVITLEFNPLFSDLITTVDSSKEEKIDFKEVCRDPVIVEQMKAHSKTQGSYNETRGDKIIPQGPKLDKDKQDVYPVFQWVCSYKIQRQENKSSGFELTSTYSIDIKLEPYCQKRAAEDGTKRIKPTHHNYNNPYSLYCADPFSKRK